MTWLRDILIDPRRFPPLQARHVIRDVVVQVALVLLLIECVFVAEKLISGLLEEVLKIRASLPVTLAMTVTLLPEVFELALPAALLIAVYRVGLAMREDREFLMLSSAGIPPHGLVRLVLVIGAGAQIAGLTVGGVVEPLSRFAFRTLMFNAQYNALMGGKVQSQHLFETRIGTVSVTPRADGSPIPRLFVRQEPEAGRERVIVANGASLSEPDESGRVALHLYDFSVDDFAQREPPGRAELHAGRPTAAPISTLSGTSTARDLVLQDVVAFDPRGRDLAELTTPELFAAAGEAAPARLELGKRLGRSLLCFLAPLIALIAISFTTRANQAVVLPLACAGLMATEIVGTAALAGIIGIGLWPMLAFLAVMAAALTLALAALAAARSSSIARPGLGRA